MGQRQETEIASTADASARTEAAPASAPANEALEATLHEDVAATMRASSVADGSGEVTLEQEGRYRLREELGRGGIGRVMIAFDRHVGREVAFKELLGGEARDNLESFAGGRFLLEARITGQLEHPAIVPVYEIGRRASGKHYYAMRLVRGRTLSASIAAARSLEKRLDLLPHFVDLCNAIAYAHSRGVVHRDIKPQNIMIGEFGETVVLDWGLAKNLDLPEVEDRRFAQAMRRLQASAGETIDGHALGTPSYMPPEQALGAIEKIGVPSDIYAMGAVLYEILTGVPPFSAATSFAVVEQVRSYGAGTLPLAPPRALVPEVPAELSAIAVKALAPRRAERYPRAKELLAEVEAYLAGRRVKSYEYSSWELLRRFAAKNKTALLFGAGLFLCAIAALVVVSLSYRKELEARRRASYFLAEALSEKATRLEAQGRFLGSRLHAAASLLNNPAEPRSLLHDPGFTRDEPGAGRLRTDAISRLYTSRHEALRRRGRLLVPEMVFHLAATPDGSRIAAALWDGNVEVRDSRSLAPLVRLRGHGGVAASVAFSPDGRLLASASWDGGVHLCETASGRERAALAPGGKRVYSVAFSRDGELLATGGDDRLVRLYRVPDLVPLATLDGHVGSVHGVAFSPDGRVIASAGTDRTVRLWPLAGGPPIVLGGHSDAVHRLGFSPDGRLLASGSSDQTVRLWRMPLGASERVLTGHDDHVWDVRFSSDGRQLVSASSDRTAMVWEVDGGRRVATLEGHRGGLYSALFLPGRPLIATGGMDRALILWEARPAHALPTLSGHQLGVYGLAFAPRGELLASTSNDATVRIWKLGKGAASEQTVLPHPERTFAVVFSPDGRLLATAAYDGRARLFDLERGALMASFPGRSPVYGVAFTSDGNELATAGGEGLRVFPRAAERPRIAIQDPRGNFWSVAVSPDGQVIAAGHAGGTLHLYARSSGKELRSWDAHRDWLTGLAYSPDGKVLASAGKDGRVVLWDPSTGRELRSLGGHSAWVNSVRFSPHSRRVYSISDDRTLTVHDTASARHLLTIPCPAEASGLAVSVDGTVAVASGSRIWLHRIGASDLAPDPAAELREAERDVGFRLRGFQRVELEDADQVGGENR